MHYMELSTPAIGNITQGTVYGEMMRAYDVMKAARAHEGAAWADGKL